MGNQREPRRAPQGHRLGGGVAALLSGIDVRDVDTVKLRTRLAELGAFFK